MSNKATIFKYSSKNWWTVHSLMLYIITKEEDTYFLYRLGLAHHERTPCSKGITPFKALYWHYSSSLVGEETESKKN